MALWRLAFKSPLLMGLWILKVIKIKSMCRDFLCVTERERERDLKESCINPGQGLTSSEKHQGSLSSEQGHLYILWTPDKFSVKAPQSFSAHRSFSIFVVKLMSIVIGLKSLVSSIYFPSF
jgi:hypothetical protein